MDANTFEPVPSIPPISVDFQLDYIAYDHAHHRMYVMNYGGIRCDRCFGNEGNVADSQANEVAFSPNQYNYFCIYRKYSKIIEQYFAFDISLFNIYYRSFRQHDYKLIAYYYPGLVITPNQLLQVSAALLAQVTQTYEVHTMVSLLLQAFAQV